MSIPGKDGAEAAIQDATLVSGPEDDAASLTVGLLSSTDDCVKVLNLAGDLTFMSCNGMQAMEIDDFEAIRGKPWATLWPAEAASMIQSAVAAAGNGDTTRFEAECPTAKGTPRVWSVTVIPVLSREGAVQRILASSHDITEKTRLTQLLQAQNRVQQDRLEAVEALLAERDHLINEMDHRVKNSLALVSTMLRMQKAQGAAPEPALDNAALRVMAIARVHEGLQARKNDRSVELAPFLTSLLGDLDTALGAEPYVSAHMDSDLWLPGNKATNLGLIVVELVQNAHKHGDAGPTGIALSLRRDADAPRFADLVIADNGPGLPEAFDLQHQGGLGLRVCRSGAAMLGSELIATPRPDGATFSLRFALE